MQNSVAPVFAVCLAASTSSGMSSQAARTGESKRPDCEQKLSGDCEPRWLISALRFDRVLACKSRDIDMAAPDTALTLLGIEFHPEKAPGGNALLLFSNGGVLRLDVECLECELADLGTDDLGAAARDGEAENARV